MSERKCRDCGGIITACNSEVDAGDFYRAWMKEIPWQSVRERCGRCAMRRLLIKEGPLVPPPTESQKQESSP